MANIAHPHLHGYDGHVALRGDPAYQAYQILHWGLVAAPAIAGLDKFTGHLVNWDQYLSPQLLRLTNSDGHALMLLSGVVEIVAALIVAVRPKIGGILVAGWLGLIIVNLLLTGRYFDIALRDFGLCLAALALARLGALFDNKPLTE